MIDRMTSPANSAAWKTLAALAIRGRTSAKSFSALPLRSACGITVDFRRQAVDADVLAGLTAFAGEIELEARARTLVMGELINPTESRPVLHTLLRRNAADPGAGEVAAAIHRQLVRIEAFAANVRAGKSGARSIADKAYTDVVVIGIGGSALGPALAVTALKRFHDGPHIHFVSNIDGAALTDTLAPLTAATTLVLVVSKTFTTEETAVNAGAAARWMHEALGADAFSRQFVAITANPDEAARQGYAAANTFVFWDGVGGRYSLWSAVGLPVALAVGYDNFAKLLGGADAMDRHFATAPFAENLPMLTAAIGVWNRNFLNIGAHAVLPYSQRLRLLPSHLQQVEMESNGKSVDRDGNNVDYPTCPVIFGEAGTNGQHSFYQLLHQGTDVISADIIIVNERESASTDQHNRLVAHALAQASALWDGYAPAGAPVHKIHPGGRPVTLIELARLDAYHLGALIAMYEHKVFAQGVMWNLNSFDQWGVELGKKIAREILAGVTAMRNNASIVSQFPATVLPPAK